METSISGFTSQALQPVTQSLDNLQKEGIPVQISLEFLSFLFLLIVVIAPVIVWGLMKNLGK